MVSEQHPALGQPHSGCRPSVHRIHPSAVAAGRAIAVSAVTGGGNPGLAEIALIRMFSAPLDWPPFPSALTLIRAVLLMEESQKQETDSLGSGCSCDYKVSGFPKVLPESKSNCLALGWDLERGVPVAGRVALSAVPRGVRGVVSGASALLWVLEGLLGLRQGATSCMFSPSLSVRHPPSLCLACHSSPRLLPQRAAVSWLPAHTPSPSCRSASGLCLSACPLSSLLHLCPLPVSSLPLGAPSPGFS